jgi:carbon monoxide dehydrogenase subunit G
MELTHEFTVPASLDDAWAAFNDLERIAPCFPGATLTSYDGESFEGLVKVKLGPISLQYTGAGRFVERDEPARRAVIEAKGRDKRGNGTAAATITASLAAAGGSTTDVTVRTDLTITGKPAQFGRGIMQDVSDKLLAQFASCLESKLAESEVAAGGPAVESAEPAAPADLGTTPPASSHGGDEAGEQAASSTEEIDSGREAEPESGSRRIAGSESKAGSEPPSAALDLGAAVVPVLLRRFAPYLVGAIAGAWLLRTILRRRRRRG